LRTNDAKLATEITHLGSNPDPPIRVSRNHRAVTLTMDGAVNCRNQVQIIEAGHAAEMKDMRNAYKILVGKT
jgi:hypothetical protein